MNRKQLTELHSHARAQLQAAGPTSALAALAPLVEAAAQEIHSSTCTYLDRDHFGDDDRRAGHVIELWRHARADWLANGRDGASPGRQVLENLVNEHMDLNVNDDAREILGAKVFGTNCRDLMRRASKSVFGTNDCYGVLADSLIERVQALRFEDWITTFRRSLDGLTAELVFVPNWDGESIDTMIYDLGLRARHWNQSLYVDEIQPCEALAKFLRWVNVGTEDLLAAARATRPDEADHLARHLVGFSVDRDAARPTLVTPAQAIEMMENAVNNCVPMYHCEVELGTLLDLDPHLPMAMSTAKGKIHIGLHDVVNGGGYMDSYIGTVTIPPDHLGFGWVGRWKYGIDSVYGLVKSVFRVVPEGMPSVKEEQAA